MTADTNFWCYLLGAVCAGWVCRRADCAPRKGGEVSLSKDEELELRELQARQTEKHERRVTDVARALCFVARINDKYGSGVEPLARVLVDIAEGWRQ